MESSPHIREGAHPTPLTYVKIAALLGIITAVEVWIFYIESMAGVLVPIFIVLSAVKFVLVAMFYMHLKFDERLFSALFVGGLVLASAVILALLTLFGGIQDASSAKAPSDAGHSSEAVADAGHSNEAVADAGHSSEAVAVIEYTSHISTTGDQLIFTTDALTAKSGENVVLEFNNNAVTQQHNWVLVQNGAKDDIATAAITAATTDWVPVGDDRIIAYSELLNPSETGTIEFTAPEAGTYQFLCTFPGHSATMFGTFEVTQ